MKKKLCTIFICMALIVTTSITPVSAYSSGIQQDMNRQIGDGAVYSDVESTLQSKEQESPSGFDAGQALKRVSKKLMATSSNIKWSITGGTLKITGTGAMPDYEYGEAPWYLSNNTDEITKIVIGSGVTSIGTFAFYELYNVEAVTVPSTVKSIGEGAFYGCTSLKSITLPSSVKSLGEGAFVYCYGLETFSGSGLTSIGAYAFQETALTSFTVPKSLTKIDYLAFFYTEIQSFAVDAGNTVYTAKSGVLYKDSGKTLFAFPAGKEVSSFAIPSNVTKIGEAAFANNLYLTKITIPNSVKTLAESAFQQCMALKSITLPDSVTEVGYFTFYECYNLESVTFGKNLKATGYQMFDGCSSLKKINFGGLTHLDDQTFVRCYGLETITLPATLKTMATGCFGECYGLTSFTSKGLDMIPFQTFWGCTSLVSVTLNEGIKSLERSSFYGCESLTSLTVPKSTTLIHSLAVPKWTKITCKDGNMEKFGVNGYRYLESANIAVERKYDKAYEVLKLVNKERAAAGLKPLYMNKSLLTSAMVRGGETVLLFSHTRPDSSSVFALNDLIIAENVAVGQTSAAEAMESWMNSPGHRENILNPSARTIGIGCVRHNGSYYWVQCFGDGSASSDCTKPANATITQKINFACDTFGEAETSYGIIWGGSDVEYTFAPKVQLNTDTISVKGTTTAKVVMTNPGFSYCMAVFKNTGINWSSMNKSVATVTSAGKVTGVAGGNTKIKAGLKHFAPTSGVYVKLKAPASVKVTTVASSGKPKVTWSKVTGASKYEVWSKKGSGGTYQKLFTTTGTTMLNTSAAAGKTYYYKVKAIHGNSKCNSAFSSVVYITCDLPQPTNIKVINVASSGKPKVTWNKVKGATKYEVWRKVGSNGTYKKFYTTTATGFTNTSAVPGTIYYYKVKAICSNSYGNSAFGSAKYKACDCARPVVTASRNTAGKPKLQWKKVTGASKYEVWRKAGAKGSYKKLYTTTGTSLTNSSAKKGTTYYYKVKAICGKSSSGNSAYSKEVAKTSY